MYYLEKELKHFSLEMLLINGILAHFKSKNL